MKKIYQVFRTTGMYEEWERVVIATYSDKRWADRHARLAQDEVVRLRPTLEKWRDRCNEIDSIDSGVEWPNFRGRSKYDKRLTDKYGFSDDARYDVVAFPVLDRPVN